MRIQLIILFILILGLSQTAWPQAPAPDVTDEDQRLWLSPPSYGYPLWSVPVTTPFPDSTDPLPNGIPLSVSYSQESWLNRVASWSQRLRLTVWRNSENRLTLGLSGSGLKFKLARNAANRGSSDEEQGAHRELLTTQSLYEDTVERTRP